MRALDSRDGIAFNVNDRGQAVGTVSGGRTLVWDLDTAEATDLGVPAHGGAGTGDINNFGQVLGSSGTPSLGTSWVWDPSTRATVEVTALPNVSAINDHAQVVGIANAHAALWNPVTP